MRVENRVFIVFSQTGNHMGLQSSTSKTFTCTTYDNWLPVRVFLRGRIGDSVLE